MRVPLLVLLVVGACAAPAPVPSPKVIYLPAVCPVPTQNVPAVPTPASAIHAGLDRIEGRVLGLLADNKLSPDSRSVINRLHKSAVEAVARSDRRPTIDNMRRAQLAEGTLDRTLDALTEK